LLKSFLITDLSLAIPFSLRIARGKYSLASNRILRSKIPSNQFFEFDRLTIRQIRRALKLPIPDLFGLGSADLGGRGWAQEKVANRPAAPGYSKTINGDRPIMPATGHHHVTTGPVPVGR
jgi:hypothetical protein